jgi:tubulin polyglutamylase TTLL4
MIDAGPRGEYADNENYKVRNLPDVPGLQDTIIDEGLHTSNASVCFSYDSGDYNSQSSQRNAKYKYSDSGPGYVQFTVRALSSFAVGNGMISSELKCVKFITDNPVSSAFLKREKGRLPYSVFKATQAEVRFIKSLFKGRAPTVFCIYPNYVNKAISVSQENVKTYNRRSESIEPLFMSFVISDRTHVYNAVVNTMKSNGFELLERGECEDFNLMWTGYTQVSDILPLNKYQKINHFPNSIHLGRKDLLWRNICRLKLKYPVAFNLAPHSWVLPEEAEELEELMQYQAMQKRMFILKPNASSCGRGIRVVQGTSKFTHKDDTIVSFYLDRPLLINNTKFDLRIYVLVTSFNPLRAYMYDEGLARFATEPYTNDPDVLKNKFVHLTNFSVNKRNTKNYVKNDGKLASENQSRPAEEALGGDGDDEDPEQESSSKWSLKFLRRYLAKKFSAVKQKYIFEGMKDAIVKTLVCVEPNIVKELNKLGDRQKCCFEVYGFDIMIDTDLNSWVLEVNCLPSLSSSSMFDKQVKSQLITDAFTLVGIRGYNKNDMRKQREVLAAKARKNNRPPFEEQEPKF